MEQQKNEQLPLELSSFQANRDSRQKQSQTDLRG
jgi:hypothetical protein